MKSFNGILIFGVVVLLMALKEKDSMEPFKWLLGDWQMERKSGVMTAAQKVLNKLCDRFVEQKKTIL